MQATSDDTQKLQQLRTLLANSKGRGPRNWSADELAALPRLYRFASSLYARLETSGKDPATLDQTRDLLRRAHATLYRGVGEDQRPWYQRLVTLLMVDSPRALRSEWKLFGFLLLAFYGLAIGAYVAVSNHLDLAFTLLDPDAVSNEIAQLQGMENGEAFRGNFTFGIGESPQVAGWIMAHNMFVSILFFASGLAVPLFAYLLASNALMVGTYTAVAAHWGQGLAISSMLWCHGTLELQAIVIAGLAGLILLRAWVAPGPWTRQQAMRLESRRAIQILAVVFPMLFVAGLIEGFITPHAELEVRMLFALVTGALFLAWLFLAGRGTAPSKPLV